MSTPYGRKALHLEASTVRGAKQGTRHDTLNRSAFNIGQLVAAHQVDEDEATGVLYDAAVTAFGTDNRETGTSESEIAAVLRDGLAAGMERPRVVPPPYETPEDAQRDLDRYAEAARRMSAGGWRGQRTRRVMGAVITIARGQSRTRDVGFGVTRLMIEAGISSRGLAHRGCRELVEDGWLRERKRSDGHHPSTYDLTIPPCSSTTYKATQSRYDQTRPGPPPGPLVRTDNARITGHDALRREALGTIGGLIWQTLTDDLGTWATQASVARTLQVCASTVGRHTRDLRPLIKHGLVERNPKGRIRAAFPYNVGLLDEIATLHRTRGRRDKQRTRLIRWYQAHGLLDDDLYWIAQDTGQRLSRAHWLDPDYPDPTSDRGDTA